MQAIHSVYRINSTANQAKQDFRVRVASSGKVRPLPTTLRRQHDMEGRRTYAAVGAVKSPPDTRPQCSATSTDPSASMHGGGHLRI